MQKQNKLMNYLVSIRISEFLLWRTLLQINSCVTAIAFLLEIHKSLK